MKARKKTSKKRAKKTGRRAMTQSAVLMQVAEDTELTKKEVKGVMLALSALIVKELNTKSRTAPGKMVIPGICRVVAKSKPARKARKGRNPFTGEDMMFKAKPATTVVKILPVKALKDAVAKK